VGMSVPTGIVGKGDTLEGRQAHLLAGGDGAPAPAFASSHVAIMPGRFRGGIDKLRSAVARVVQTLLSIFQPKGV